jgi:esterase/lipase superfamily enzyme
VVPRILWLLSACVFLGACDVSVQLAQTPNVLLPVAEYPDAALPAQLRTTQPTIYFVTDREQADNPTPELGYTFERSASMALGKQQLTFGNGLTWQELKLLSVLKRTSDVPVYALNSDEVVRFPPTPVPLVRSGSRLVPDPVIARSYAKASEVFRAEIRNTLHAAGQDEVLIYVHGANNDFQSGSATLANIWHFSGRTALPIVYTWPAGNPGLLGYFTDSESSIFSIYHFKEFLGLLRDMPEVKRINLIAHSQGTALTTSALREMIIAERAMGHDPRRSLKINNLILAAPDLNYDVFGQRFLAERFNDAFGQVVIYTSSKDKALGVAQRFMRGVRLGRVTYADLDTIEQRVLLGAQNVHIVNVEAVVGRDSHSYFHQNPDVLSDVVITLRTGVPPGGAERPLEHQEGNFWNLHAGYPFERPVRVFAINRVDP